MYGFETLLSSRIMLTGGLMFEDISLIHSMITARIDSYDSM